MTPNLVDKPIEIINRVTRFDMVRLLRCLVEYPGAGPSKVGIVLFTNEGWMGALQANRFLMAARNNGYATKVTEGSWRITEAGRVALSQFEAVARTVAEG